MSNTSLPRRAFLAAAAGTAGSSLLAACSLRLERPTTVSRQERSAAVRTSAAANAEATVLAALAADAEALAATAAAVRGNGTAAGLARAHREQAGVLRAWARALGAGAPSTSATASPGRPDTATLRRAELAGLDADRLAPLLTLVGQRRATAAAVSAHRVAAARLLSPKSPRRALAPLPATTAAALTAPTREALAALRTAAGRSEDAPKQQAMVAAVELLAAWESDLTLWAGTLAPTDPPAYRLTTRPGSAEQTLELARTALRSVVEQTLPHLADLEDGETLLSLVVTVGEVSASAYPLGAGLPAFPGLRR